MSKVVTAALIVSLLFLQMQNVVHAKGTEEKENQSIEKIKADIAKRGTGENAAVRIKRKDKSEVKGYISQAGEESFVITTAKTGEAVTIPYSDVKEVKGKAFPKNQRFSLLPELP